MLLFFLKRKPNNDIMYRMICLNFVVLWERLTVWKRQPLGKKKLCSLEGKQVTKPQRWHRKSVFWYPPFPALLAVLLLCYCLFAEQVCLLRFEGENWHRLTDMSHSPCLSHFSLADSDNNIIVFHWLSLLYHFSFSFTTFLPASQSLTLCLCHRTTFPSFLFFPTVILFSSSLSFSLTAVPQHQRCKSPTICPPPSTTPSLLPFFFFLLLFFDIDSCHGASMQ